MITSRGGKRSDCTFGEVSFFDSSDRIVVQIQVMQVRKGLEGDCRDVVQVVPAQVQSVQVPGDQKGNWQWAIGN